MTEAQFFFSAWEWEPSVLIGCLVTMVLYFSLAGGHGLRRTVYFVSGIISLIAALDSPLDALSDTYLFSAHMLQHMILIMVTPVLLLLGLGPETARGLFRHPWARAVFRKIHKQITWVSQPGVTWITANGTLWIWHLPYLYNLTLENETVHIFEHLTFLVSWSLFWWPILTPLTALRLPPLWATLYLLSAALSNSALGIWLSFLPPGLYPVYSHPEDTFKILWWLNGKWGLNPAADQQLGGLLMWVVGGVVFLVAIIAQFARWYQMREIKSKPVQKIFLKGAVK